tara:strand:+ start:234 stop:428 length:195 start_codon:yes stop_codon:yes gene_type:complete
MAVFESATAQPVLNFAFVRLAPFHWPSAKVDEHRETIFKSSTALLFEVQALLVVPPSRSMHTLG